jgi:hypothetical protein
MLNMKLNQKTYEMSEIEEVLSSQPLVILESLNLDFI